jgi:hypothetical protein
MNEYMTGTASRNPVFSELTLSVLEDTGWYRANYSLAGQLLWGQVIVYFLIADFHTPFARRSSLATRPPRLPRLPRLPRPPRPPRPPRAPRAFLITHATLYAPRIAHSTLTHAHMLTCSLCAGYGLRLREPSMSKLASLQRLFLHQQRKTGVLVGFPSQGRVPNQLSLERAEHLPIFLGPIRNRIVRPARLLPGDVGIRQRMVFRSECCRVITRQHGRKFHAKLAVLPVIPGERTRAGRSYESWVLRDLLHGYVAVRKAKKESNRNEK